MKAEWQDTQRCQACGGLNDEAATFCGQCFVSLERTEEEPEPSGRVAAALRGSTFVPQAPSAAVTDDETGGLFGVWNGQPSWKCLSCGSFNGMAADTCPSCGATFMQSAGKVAEVSTALKRADSNKTAFRVFVWAARFMLLVAGFLEPQVFFWAAAYYAVRFGLKQMMG